jgi:two-component system, OmpR family, phosphate regulon response regulator PhoB
MPEVAAGCLGHFTGRGLAKKTETAPRVLSIEDDAAMGQFLKAVFSAQGFTMDLATDGNAGLDLARRRRPDLVILDLLMPYKNGFEVLKELKDAPETRAVPVIILSSNSREEDIVKALNAGADDFVVKPFRARELVTRVRKVLERVRPAP